MLFLHFLAVIHPIFSVVDPKTYGESAGRAIALGVGAGGGAAGAGMASEVCSVPRSRPRRGSPSCARTSSATNGSASR